MRYRYFAALLSMSAALCAFAPSAYAASVIKQQPYATMQVTVNDGRAKMGTGLSGVVGMVQGGMSLLTDPGTDPLIRIGCFNDAAYTTPCEGSPTYGEYNFSVGRWQIVYDGSQRMYIATSSDRTLTLDASRYYEIASVTGGVAAYGTSTNTSSFAYVVWNDGSAPPQSGIDVIYSPYNGQNASAFPTVSYQYTNTDLYDYAGAYLNDYTSYTNVAVDEDYNPSNGTFTFTKTLALTNGHTYTFQPYIRSSATGDRLTGSIISFQVATTTNALMSLVASSTSSGSASTCNVLSGFDAFTCIKYLVIPDDATFSLMKMYGSQIFLQTAPFSYFNTFISGAQMGLTNATTSTSTLPSLNITLPTGFPGAGTQVDLTPWGKLLGDGTILSTAQNPNTGDTIRDIVEPGWSMFVYTLLILALGTELVGWGGKVVSVGRL